MKLSTTLISLGSFLGISLFSINAAFAETPPTTKCVTAATTATHASYSARMEKDIAPYAQTSGAAAAIQKYRDSMTVAWNAMNEPYCGYGDYGTASAIKSYGKSVVRAQAAFATAVKGLSKGKVVVQAIVETTVKTTSATHAAPVVVAPPKVSSASISSGLTIGMRSSAVTVLQNKLAAYFHLAADASTVTGYFGPKTEGLVEKFQIEKKIISSAQSYGAGCVGPKTAAALSSL